VHHVPRHGSVFRSTTVRVEDRDSTPAYEAGSRRRVERAHGRRRTERVGQVERARLRVRRGSRSSRAHVSAHHRLDRERPSPDRCAGTHHAPVVQERDERRAVRRVPRSSRR
jgi:hypothetical protein